MEEIEKIEDPRLQLPRPVWCHLWQKEVLTREDLTFESVNTLADESHFQRAVLRCTQCEQHYFYEWFEEIDWDEGDDKMYTTFIPIPLMFRSKFISELNQRSSFELLMVSPRLQWDNGGEIKWIE